MLAIFLETAGATPVFWSNGDDIASSPPLGFNEKSPNMDREFFEDFTVSNPQGINITGLWSQNLVARGGTTLISSLQWTIHRLMTVQDDGDEIAKGTSPVTLIPNGAFVITTQNFITGPVSQMFDGWQFLATGLNVHLDPGTYSFAVTPILAQEISCFDGLAHCAPTIQETDGVNAIGSPTGNHNGIQWDLEFPPHGPAEIHRTDTQTDLSMGVFADVVTPEPGTLALAALPLAIGALRFFRS